MGTKRGFGSMNVEYQEFNVPNSAITGDQVQNCLTAQRREGWEFIGLQWWWPSCAGRPGSAPHAEFHSSEYGCLSLGLAPGETR